MEIISQEKITVNDNQAYVTIAQGYFSANGEKSNVKFKEIMIYDSEKYYTIAYSNDLGNFNFNFQDLKKQLIPLKYYPKILP